MNDHVDFMPGAHYHALTPAYETLARPLLHAVWKRTAREVARRAPAGGTVVDIGSGPGTVLRIIRDKRADLSLHGIDIDARMIQSAERKSAGRNIGFQTASADSLPFPDASTDIALSTMVFHHLPLQVKGGALREVKRILKPGGELLLCDFSSRDQGPKQPLGILATLLSACEPEVRPQLKGQLFKLALENGASIQTVWFPGRLIGMHSIRFLCHGDAP